MATAITGIVIPKSVKLLDRNCFYNCVSLISIVFEKNSQLERIGEYACTSTAITEIVIPKSVKLLDSNCFYNCVSLASVWIEDDSHLSKIGANAFYLCAVVSLKIPASVTALENHCFSHCFSLEQVIFEKNSLLRTIGESTLLRSAIRSIVIPASVSLLDIGCFFNCISLASIVFEAGSNLREIGSCAFAECSALESIILPESMIVDRTQGLREKFPAMLAHFDGDIRGYGIQEHCFSGGTSLKHVTFVLPACVRGRVAFTMFGVGDVAYESLHLWQTLGFPAHSDAYLGSHVTEPRFPIPSRTSIEAFERTILPYMLGGFVIIDSFSFVNCPALETVRFVSPQLEKEISGAELHAFFEGMQFVIVSADGDSLARIATEQGMLPPNIRVFGELPQGLCLAPSVPHVAWRLSRMTAMMTAMVILMMAAIITAMRT
jgi:hypothetical protein